MAIAIVGSSQADFNNNGGDVILTFDGSPAEDDFVVVTGGNADNDSSGPIGPSTGGYTQRGLQMAGGSERATGVWTKFLSSSPDSGVVGQGSGSAQEATAYASIVLRGVDLDTPLDVSIVETGPTTSAERNLDSIDTATDDAWVILCVGGGGDDVPSAGPTGYGNLATAGDVDTRRYCCALCTKEVTSAGTEDPGDFSGWLSNAWYGFTVAIRPAGAGGDFGKYIDLDNRRITRVVA